jgi:hypothetical protein
MSKYVPIALRRYVAQRARHICEYCLIHEDDTFWGCEIEHIISEKHGGKTTRSNLAWACAMCNRNKGTDIATISPATHALCRLFNPRTDRWNAHFQIRAGHILGKTEIGKVTVLLLDLNARHRILERRQLAAVGRFPSDAARELIGRP